VAGLIPLALQTSLRLFSASVIKKGRDFFITAFECAGNKKSREDPRGSPRL
jgi:hypothetical protein